MTAAFAERSTGRAEIQEKEIPFIRNMVTIMARNWTPSQSTAITLKNCDLLVSAGAGSGKTAVLTERIIRHITDKESPSDINRMLIVTFTKAAAGELKERISTALYNAIAENPTDKRLSKQIFSLDRAKICTIHSYCLDLIKDNFTKLGLPADFRIGDSAEILLLQNRIMNSVIEDYYSNSVVGEYAINDFEEFSDNFSSAKSDDRLADAFLKIYHTFASYRENIEFIKDFSEELRNDSNLDFGKSRCGMSIIQRIRRKMSGYRSAFADVMPEILEDEKMSKAFLPAFEADVKFIDDFEKCTESGDFNSLKSLFNETDFPRMGIIRGAELPCRIIEAKEKRTEFHTEIKSISKKYFMISDDTIRKNQLKTSETLEKLYHLLKLFDDRFSEEKKKRGVVDFNDLEKMAAKLLRDENGMTTSIADAERAKYDEIYIDEYQDVNALQDSIFSAIGNGRNRFMVGDIKQSIYAFRGAQPDIFEEYRSHFYNVSDTTAPDDAGRKVYLSDNFRCDNNVIKFTNIVSNYLFTHEANTFTYYPEDDLVHSKDENENQIPVKIALIPSPDREDEEEEDTSDAEAEYIASEIMNLVNTEKTNGGKNICYSDIAIISRSTKESEAIITDVLSSCGIPVASSGKNDFFDNPEILLMLSLLNVIDNPRRDIFLAGLLKSPLYGFTLDDLINIRLFESEGCLYDALKSYTDSNEFKKGSFFLNKLTEYRKKAENLSVDRLIRYIYSDTDIIAGVSDRSGAKDRLLTFYEYARQFESSSFKGLYNFIAYLNDIITEQAEAPQSGSKSDSSNRVKIMTIHQSKGLEFPVVFIAGCGKKINRTDLNSNLVVERKLGIASKLIDQTGLARFDTPIRQAIVGELSDSQLNEEMRVLYVAMTRARERLYITGTVKDPESTVSAAKKASVSPSSDTILTHDGYFQWILSAIFAYEKNNQEDLPYTIEIAESQSDLRQEEKPDGCQEEVMDEIDYPSLIRERFDYVYPHSHTANLPAKMAVSRLYPTVLDEDDDIEEEAATYKITEKRPLFMSEDAADRSTSAERGTATHLFMQFCDFSAISPDNLPGSIRAEADRLCVMKFITPRIKSLINFDHLQKFFEGELFRQICLSKNVVREKRFNVRLPAAQFTENEDLKAELDGEFVLVQGVVDCYFENPDQSITLIDYKTDFIPREMSRSQAEDMLRCRHGNQLSYYKTALERITKKKVSRVAIYSFGLGDTVELV